MQNIVLVLVVIGIAVLGVLIVKMLNRFLKSNIRDAEEKKNGNIFSDGAGSKRSNKENGDDDGTKYLAD